MESRSCKRCGATVWGERLSDEEDLCEKCDARQRASRWNPRPHPDLSATGRKAYFAGYSDGFHGAPFGAGDDGSIGAFSDYRPGFNDGRADATAV
ncbi:hypothetical protein CAF53_02465 [Sphingobium sp. LB126]|uniref:hypothetical protein n=1 Tax=Sphingobium sp. LB126 TaxID=1983755 RepID=UPI000C206ACD|nr:hypothetical protein [Sphingobium sp. LB126]PJG47229.1 hypothetical protein CAF53_02465 [Sphingobium sp. LB126]